MEPDVWKRDGSKEEGRDEGKNGGDGYLHGRRWRESGHREEGGVGGGGERGVILFLAGDSVPAGGDECHYITTHEIQLSELSDHEADYEQGSSAGVPVEEEVEEGEEVREEDRLGGRGNEPRAASQCGAGVSTLTESDPRHAANFSSSEERASQSGAGQTHVSIRTTSRAINDPSNIQEQGGIFNHAGRSGDIDRCNVLRRETDGKEDTSMHDRAKRLHIGRQLRRKDAPEYSSGTSSAVSELDDADKEVRSLTGRAFKSLAHPCCFHAPKCSTSTESSASERAVEINRWSTVVELKYGSANVTRGLDQSVVSHQSSTLEIAQNVNNTGYRKGVNAPRDSLPFTQKVQPMGDFGQGQGGLIRLTKTLNFCCNVKSGMSAAERRTNFAQNAAGSRSPDEVTISSPSSPKRVTTKQPGNSMGDTHKKAILASSLIKNVISKKIQFEQERKMERGEIREPHRGGPLCLGPRAAAGGELHRHSSRFSDSGSAEYALACVDEMGDIADSGSCCETTGDPRRRAPVTDTEVDPTNEAGIVTKKGASGACGSMLLLSQNSAFRCWRDEEVEFQRDRKNHQTPAEPSHPQIEAEGEQRSADGSKRTEMSRLFVPSVQPPSGDADVGQQLGRRSTCPGGDGGGMKLRPDNTLRVAASRRVATSRSPEIKINLRSVRENEGEPAPDLGCNAASLCRTDDFKCQARTAALRAEAGDCRAPHFTVRDIRDNKGKLQTPIHQVRDVRKLVKSSYHFVSLDSSENRATLSCSDGLLEKNRRHPNKHSHSVSPIVIKCQSVNTNSSEKQSGNLGLPQMCCEGDKLSPEGFEGSEEGGAAGTDSHVVPKRSEKALDSADKKSDSRMTNQATNQVALEKLQAAVKTMEQLYVYEKKEWKRKNEPHPLTDSHLLSLIATEGGRGGGVDKTVGCTSCSDVDRSSPSMMASLSTDSMLWHENKDGRLSQSVQSPSNPRSKTMFNLSSDLKSYTSGTKTQLNSVKQTPFYTKIAVPKSPKVPVSLKTSRNRIEGAESKEADRFTEEFSSAPVDNENCLTIPVKSHPTNSRQPAEKTSVYPFSTESPPGQGGPGTRARTDSYPTPKLSSFVMETPSPDITSATIYHSVPRAMPASQPQFYCFPPAVSTAPPNMDPFQSIQRKVLLDPSTGSYYLVDTPVQPATKRLFDPETGHYVDVPMSHTPMTPMPVTIPHLALSPGPAYMIYPSFMRAPSVIQTRTLAQSQLSMQSEVGSGEPGTPQQMEGIYMESPLYMTTGSSAHTACGAQHSDTTTTRPPHGVASVSINSQQGPRIIAPPSFDGTTMSFVVEHR